MVSADHTPRLWFVTYRSAGLAASPRGVAKVPSFSNLVFISASLCWIETTFCDNLALAVGEGIETDTHFFEQGQVKISHRLRFPLRDVTPSLEPARPVGRFYSLVSRPAGGFRRSTGT